MVIRCVINGNNGSRIPFDSLPINKMPCDCVLNSKRDMFGTAKPTKAIGPQNAVIKPVKIAVIPIVTKRMDLTFKPNENAEHLLNIQISNSSNINMYDRLTETSKGLPVYAEWYYGPQIRNLISYKFTATKLPGYFSDLMVTSSFQDIEESRITRKFNTPSKDFRFERVNVLGVNADLLHRQANGEIHFGVESYTNFVKSTANAMVLYWSIST